MHWCAPTTSGGFWVNFYWIGEIVLLVDDYFVIITRCRWSILTWNCSCKLIIDIRITRILRCGIKKLSLSNRNLMLIIDILVALIVSGLRSASLFGPIQSVLHWDVVHINLSIANSLIRPFITNFLDVSPILFQELAAILRVNWLLLLLVSYPHSIILWRFRVAHCNLGFANHVWRLSPFIGKTCCLRNIGRYLSTLLICIHPLI